MKVERLCHAHLRSVAALEALCFGEPWSEHALELLCGDGAAGVVICDADQNALAYGGILWAPDEGQITNIAVAPNARRTGMGSMILDALIRLAQERGCRELSLEVRESNRAAVALYEKYGFLTAGRRKRFYRNPAEDALVMLLQLGAYNDWKE